MNTEEKELKENITKRLKGSNKSLWNSLSPEKQEFVVSKYYDLTSVESVGITSVLEDDRSIRRNIGGIVVGLLLGLFGGITSNVLLKYLPDSIGFDVFAIVMFVILFTMLIRMIDQISIDRLKSDRILEYLLKND